MSISSVRDSVDPEIRYSAWPVSSEPYGDVYHQITYIAVRPLCGHIGGNHLAGCRVEVHLLLGVLASVCNADVTEAAVSACSVPGTTDMHTLTFADFRPSSVQPGRRT